jgi:hypothetical protein
MATIFAGVLSVIGMSPRNELRGPRQNTADWYTYIGTCGGGGADAGAAPVQQDGRVGVRSAVIDAGPEGRRGRRGLLPCARAEECSLPGRLDTPSGLLPCLRAEGRSLPGRLNKACALRRHAVVWCVASDSGCRFVVDAAPGLDTNGGRQDRLFNFLALFAKDFHK